MSELTDKLSQFGEQHKGTDLGGLLQWAALHIDSQDEALADLRTELAEEEAERMRLERNAKEAKTMIEAACVVLQYTPPVDFTRDLAGHINLMCGHGDPDYTKKNGQSIRHVDTRETAKPRKAKP
jgi:hypothetical protein